MNAPVHILVVDDDPEVRDLIGEYLTEEGFEMSVAADGEEMRNRLMGGPVDLVILDVRLPGEDGLALAAEIRRERDAGIIMLSRKDDLADRVAGLEVGADDYVAKPFHLRELLARVRSVLRRRQAEGPPVANKTPARNAEANFRFDGFEVDRRKRVLLDPGGNVVNLSAGEFKLLLAFAEHPNRPLSRDQLLDFAYGRDASLFDRSVDVQIGRLRRKIEANPKRPELIKTIRGVGYMLDAEVRTR